MHLWKPHFGKKKQTCSKCSSESPISENKQKTDSNIVYAAEKRNPTRG